MTSAILPKLSLTQTGLLDMKAGLKQDAIKLCILSSQLYYFTKHDLQILLLYAIYSLL